MPNITDPTTYSNLLTTLNATSEDNELDPRAIWVPVTVVSLVILGCGLTIWKGKLWPDIKLKISECFEDIGDWIDERRQNSARHPDVENQLNHPTTVAPGNFSNSENQAEKKIEEIEMEEKNKPENSAIPPEILEKDTIEMKEIIPETNSQNEDSKEEEEIEEQQESDNEDETSPKGAFFSHGVLIKKDSESEESEEEKNESESEETEEEGSGSSYSSSISNSRKN